MVLLCLVKRLIYFLIFERSGSRLRAKIRYPEPNNKPLGIDQSKGNKAEVKALVYFVDHNQDGLSPMLAMRR